jgi:hypothetical protein
MKVLTICPCRKIRPRLHNRFSPQDQLPLDKAEKRYTLSKLFAPKGLIQKALTIFRKRLAIPATRSPSFGARSTSMSFATAFVGLTTNSLGLANRLLSVQTAKNIFKQTTAKTAKNKKRRHADASGRPAATWQDLAVNPQLRNGERTALPQCEEILKQKAKKNQNAAFFSAKAVENANARC